MDCFGVFLSLLIERETIYGWLMPWMEVEILFEFV